MVKYAKSEYKKIGFEKSKNKKKMYDLILENKETGRRVRLGFGDPNLENYSDKTGLNAYPKLVHNDKQRRRQFRQRFSGLKQKQDWNKYYTPLWASWTYLW